MGGEVWLAIIAGGALFVDIIAHLIGGMWLLSRSREQMAASIEQKIEERREAVEKQFSNFRGEIGETFAAMRQALADVGKDISRVELEAYKTFVRRESFQEVMNRQQDVVAARLDKMDSKIETLTTAINQQMAGRSN